MNTSTLRKSLAGAMPSAVTESGERIVRRLLDGFPGAIEVRLWDEVAVHVGKGEPDFRLNLHNPSLLRRLVLDRSPLVLAEAHFNGELDFDGDVFSVLKLRKHFEGIELSFGEKMSMLAQALKLPKNAGVATQSVASRLAESLGFDRSHSKESDRAAISFHYDVSNDFYRTFLCDQMIYSCAYFGSTEDTLEQAQRNKLDHICRKLRLKAGERLLDIGCGWGALVCWAAKHYGVTAHGITLSKEQLVIAQQRIAEQGLSDRVTVELRDYRDVQGQECFDKISSVGMFEHVGLKNLKAYNATVFRLLKQDGLFLNHGITHDTQGWHTGLNSQFLQKFVFPDGELDTVSNIQGGMESAGFEILDVEGLRPHYALTLRQWVDRLEKNKATALKHVDEKTFRVWRMYMAGSALEFENGGTGIHQILGGKWRRSNGAVPLTRKDIYGI